MSKLEKEERKIKETEIAEKKEDGGKAEGKENTPGKVQRILAMLGVIFLVLLYVVTLISAIFTTPATKGLFMACIFSTVAIPIMLYGYVLVYRILKR